MRPLPRQPLPSRLRARDGQVDGASPEDVFTWETVSSRMPKILDAMLETLPEALAVREELVQSVRELQSEMRDGAPLRRLEDTGPWVSAEAWNEHLEELLAQNATWHSAPWWIVENYMYKRVLELFGRCGGGGACYDPFAPQKYKAITAAAGALEKSVCPLLERVEAAAAASISERQAKKRPRNDSNGNASDVAPQPGHGDLRAVLQDALLRSLWGNQADLSLSAGRVEETDGGCGNEIISNHTAIALDMLFGAAGRPVVFVLDNHGLEVVCDLVLVDALLSLVGVASVSLHVKDVPVFVSDVTEGDMPGILEWVEAHMPTLAARLRDALQDDRLRVVPSAFYTSARDFWELPQGLRDEYRQAAAVILKGDANFRRLLGDRHWPYDTDFDAYARSFWPCPGLLSLRTMKSGVALGIPQDKQVAARAAHPHDWLTSGRYGQVLVSWREQSP